MVFVLQQVENGCERAFRKGIPIFIRHIESIILSDECQDSPQDIRKSIAKLRSVEKFS
jgi:hypothetical protein